MRNKKWKVTIGINGVNYHLGYYEDEKVAGIVYETALKNWEEKEELPNYRNPKYTSKYKGVCFKTDRLKWQAQTTVNGKKKSIGFFNTEEDAYQAYKNFHL